MLGQAAIVSPFSSSSGSRVFVYEVTGLHQNEETDRQSYTVRNSSSVFIKVPYSRMNEVMRNISRLGGKIVNISPLTGNAQSDESEE